MSELWVDQDATREQLASFFVANKDDVKQFGKTVNQVFEAFVFASVIRWYKASGWNVTFVQPKGLEANKVRLKFNTRGQPDKYTYAQCEKEGTIVQVRHQLRTATRWHSDGKLPPANVVLDVAVIQNQDLSAFGTNDYAANAWLVSFGEAKHMSAFAELVANFLGLIHEMKPTALENGSRPADSPASPREHLAPFLYVSGKLYWTAQGIQRTIKERGYDIDIYDYTSTELGGVAVPSIPAP